MAPSARASRGEAKAAYEAVARQAKMVARDRRTALELIKQLSAGPLLKGVSGSLDRLDFGFALVDLVGAEIRGHRGRRIEQVPAWLHGLVKVSGFRDGKLDRELSAMFSQGITDEVEPGEPRVWKVWGHHDEVKGYRAPSKKRRDGGFAALKRAMLPPDETRYRLPKNARTDLKAERLNKHWTGILERAVDHVREQLGDQNPFARAALPIVDEMPAERPVRTVPRRLRDDAAASEAEEASSEEEQEAAAASASEDEAPAPPASSEAEEEAAPPATSEEEAAAPAPAAASQETAAAVESDDSGGSAKTDVVPAPRSDDDDDDDDSEEAEDVDTEDMVSAPEDNYQWIGYEEGDVAINVNYMPGRGYYPAHTDDWSSLEKLPDIDGSGHHILTYSSTRALVFVAPTEHLKGVGAIAFVVEKGDLWGMRTPADPSATSARYNAVHAVLNLVDEHRFSINFRLGGFDAVFGAAPWADEVVVQRSDEAVQRSDDAEEVGSSVYEKTTLRDEPSSDEDSVIYPPYFQRRFEDDDEIIYPPGFHERQEQQNGSQKKIGKTRRRGAETTQDGSPRKKRRSRAH
mmetsp:Transcript_19167/g.59084  ORF Transcript_19167/g.59084 Transcript_19167/m.59084 type:complete len:575 (-) Transcript_19167:482-2206(-)